MVKSRPWSPIMLLLVAELAVQVTVAAMTHPTAQISDNNSACSSTVWVAFSRLSGG